MSYVDLQNLHQPLLESLIEKQYMNVPQSGIFESAKDDAPILSTTTGYFNATFGASIFQQLNTSSTLFRMLPKFNYQRAGYRAGTTRFKNSGLGAAENAAIADTVKPDRAQVTVGIKEQQLAFEFSQRELLLSGTLDDVGFEQARIIEQAKMDFAYAFDADMNVNVTTVAGNNAESIDRVVSSYAEVTNCADVTANDADIYGLDRDAGATWADAYVNHNSGTIRPISKALIGDLVANTIKAGANPATQAWYMGEDAWNQISELEASKIRYTEPSSAFRAGTNINDGQAAVGNSLGLEMGTLRGRPVYIAPSDKVAQSGTSGTGSAISNVYLLDLGVDPIYKEPWLGVKVLRAPILAETRLENYPVHQKLGNKTVIYSAMELHCSRFNIQGKLRDIGAAV